MSTTFVSQGSGGNSGNSGVLGSLFSSAASIANTSIIANANPVNAALLSNSPISSPSTGVTGALGGSGYGMILIIGILVIGAFALFGRRG